jgi:hypothetical protein
VSGEKLFNTGTALLTTCFQDSSTTSTALQQADIYIKTFKLNQNAIARSFLGPVVPAECTGLMTRLAQNEGIIPWVTWVWLQGYVPVKHVLNSCVLHDLLMREAYHKAGKAYP